MVWCQCCSIIVFSVFRKTKWVKENQHCMLLLWLFMTIEAVGAVSVPLTIVCYTKRLRQEELMICATCRITSCHCRNPAVHGDGDFSWEGLIWFPEGLSLIQFLLQSRIISLRQTIIKQVRCYVSCYFVVELSEVLAMHGCSWDGFWCLR